MKAQTRSEKIQNDKQNNYIYLGPDSFFYRQSDNNFISLFSGQKVNVELIEKIYKEWESEGHDVFALGYASSTSGTPYILVMGGWNNYERFVKYDYFPVVKGYKIWVS